MTGPRPTRGGATQFRQPENLNPFFNSVIQYRDRWQEELQIMKRAEGKRMLATGGTIGIGLATTQEFVREGTMNEDLSVAQRAVAPFEINLTGSQLLVGLMFGLCLVSLFAWVFVRYWLFA